MSEACARGIWGLGGNPDGDVPLVELIKPSAQVLNDVCDGYAINHHERDDPWVLFAKMLSGDDDMQVELKAVADFIEQIEQPNCETWITYSNHDDFFARFLRNTDWRDNLRNAELYLASNLAKVRAVKAGNKAFNVFDWMLRRLNKKAKFKLATVDTVLQFFKHQYQLHGDNGINGSRGTTVGLKRLGRPTGKAHDHAGTWMDFVKSMFNIIDASKVDYAKGPTTWANGICIEHPNGQFQMCPMNGSKYRP